MKRGFTLIEVLIIAAVVTIVTTFMINNFSSSRTYLRDSTNAVLSDIRSAQSRSISGAHFNNETEPRCGYGVHYIDTDSYLIFVAPQPEAANGFCSSLDRNYNSVGSISVRDLIVEQKDILNDGLMFANSFNDIFFEPPDPKTYINGVYAVDNSSERITIREIANGCAGEPCKSICVYHSGKIEVKDGGNC
jgi:type II secretory pathway pseudopilin PulG